VRSGFFSGNRRVGGFSQSSLNDTGEKNAPSLAARGKSTFSEGGGDKRFVLSNKKARLFEILHKNCCGATLLQRLYDCKLEN
jgi:hypothetical protein